MIKAGARQAEKSRRLDRDVGAARSRGHARGDPGLPEGRGARRYNYWEDPYDRGCAIKSLRLAREILRQPALKPFALAERLPDDNLETGRELAECAFRSCKTDHNGVGTCAMGTGPDQVMTPDL